VPDLALSIVALLPQSGVPYVALLAAGFAIGILGHLAGSNRLIAVGVALIFLGAFLLPLLVNLTESTPPQVERAR
jgi:predicted Na+-dependent transporter